MAGPFAGTTVGTSHKIFRLPILFIILFIFIFIFVSVFVLNTRGIAISLHPAIAFGAGTAGEGGAQTALPVQGGAVDPDESAVGLVQSRADGRYQVTFRVQVAPVLGLNSQ